MRSFASMLTLVAGIGVASSVALASCTYDFDGAFSDSPGSTGTETGAGGGGGVSPTGGSAGTATTGGGGTGGVAGTGGTGGTGGDPGGEDCTNGTDDDGDQRIDCADTDCQQGWECAVEPSAEWDGPFAVYVGTSEPPPSCDGLWSTFDDYGIGIQVPAAQCSTCVCSAPSLQCSLPDTTLFDLNGCNPLDTIQVLSPTADGACIPFSTPHVEAALLVDSVDQDSFCSESGGALSAPAITWSQDVRICRGTLLLGGCGGQQVCAPQRDADFQRCITRVGVFVCPAPYTERTLFYASHTDTRDCSTCTCGDPASLSCDGYTELFDTPACASVPVESYNAQNECDAHDVQPIASGSYRYTATNSSDSCPAQGGQLSGSVTEDDLTTLCCLP